MLELWDTPQKHLYLKEDAALKHGKGTQYLKFTLKHSNRRINSDLQ